MGGYRVGSRPARFGLALRGRRVLRHGDDIKKSLNDAEPFGAGRVLLFEGRGVRAHANEDTTMTTLHTVQAAVVSVAEQNDANTATLAERVAAAVSALRAYVPADAAAPRDTAEFKNAADTIKVALRQVYVQRARFTGRDRSAPVNMVMAEAVLNMTDVQREALPKDGDERKVWDAMLAYCRNIWRDIADAAFPKADKADGEGKAKGKAKAAPTPDTILANLDAFLASNPAPALVANLFDQIAKRRPAAK